MRDYSVLLLYPDYLNDSGTETYYDWTEAETSEQAIEDVQRMAKEKNPEVEDHTDFAVLLVLQGHIELRLREER
jgi:hypothetical protein